MARFVEQIADLLGSLYGWILLVLCQVFMISGVKAGLIGLGVVFIIDYITGLVASWTEWKAAKVKRSTYFLESKKFRKSLLKATTYFLFVGMSYLMWYLVFDGGVQLPVSNKEVNIITVAFGICIAIECWSILENMKRSGYDILGAFRTAFKGFLKTYNEVKKNQ